MTDFCLIHTLFYPWDNYPRKPFTIATANIIKEKGGIILCLEPTVFSLHTLIKHPHRLISWSMGKYRFRKVGDNIYSFAPFTFEHIILSVRFKPLLLINKFVLKFQILKVLKYLNIKPENSIWVIHRPELYYLIGLLKEKGSIYDCCDDYTVLPGKNKFKVLGNKKREKILSEKSNFVITSSLKFYNRNLLYNKNTYLVENGYSSKVFNEYCPNPDILYLNELKKPIIGYIGNVRSWLDFELLEYIISSRPNWTFLFAGGVIGKSKKQLISLIKRYRNVVSIGDINYSDYPKYLKYFDVGIIPFVQNEFMQSANPNKLYEYLGLGIPIVSTNIGDIQKLYSDVVMVGNSKEEFLQCLDNYFMMSAENKSSLALRILKIGKEHTWELSAKNFFDLITLYFNI